MAYKYVFGPIKSSRLGRSLGLDLLGKRICSMDCIYCEVGATRDLTIARKPYVPASILLEELAKWKNEGFAPPDIVTLGGLGEPSLNSEMAHVIEGARVLFPNTDIAVLTNSSLISDPTVRQELALADVILPSLDSLEEKEFSKINRPCGEISPAAIGEGLLEFKKEFSGKIFLEILLIEGVNDSDANLKKLIDFSKRLNPDRVDVVTTTRPGTVRSARAVSKELLSYWRTKLERGTKKSCPTGCGHKEHSHSAHLIEHIYGSLSRRPQTVTQLAGALHAPTTEVQLALDSLLEKGMVLTREDQGEMYYHGTGHVIED